MEKNNYSAKIDNLITLCHIIDDFEEFEKRLLPVLSSKYNRYFVFQLWDVSKSKFKLGARKAKKFYIENKVVIDTINQYSTVLAFINLNYGWHGEPSGDLQFFYQYISSRKEEIDKILALLEKLKDLGFNDIQFNGDLNFTQETHKIYTLFSDNFDITYLNNLTAIPNYNPGVILYKTNNSGYKITIGVSFGNIKKYDIKIVLNDLTFNPDELPNAISKEETFDKIIGLKEKKQQEYSVIKDSVNLGIGIADLYVMFNVVSSRINQLENVEKKAELTELLQTIKEAILKMQTISTEYNQKVAEKNPSISEEFLEEQKKAYVRTREYSNIHIW